jgi:transposase
VGADHLLPAVADDAPIVNREFDADNSVIKPMAAVGKTAAIPLRANRSSPRDYDRQLYGARHLIENFNHKLKRFRPIATRYEKTAREALAVRQLVASVVWLN